MALLDSLKSLRSGRLPGLVTYSYGLPTGRFLKKSSVRALVGDQSITKDIGKFFRKPV